MPLRLGALTEQNASDTFVSILGDKLQHINDAFAQSNKRYFLGSTPLTDEKTGKQIGKYVFTFFSNIEMQRNEILDIDIVLDNDSPVELSFSTRLKKSSDSNEYYEAVTVDTEQHLVVETVNRYVIESEIEEKNVYIELSMRDFALVDEEGKCLVNPGKYTISVGGQQPDALSEKLTGKKVDLFTITKNGSIMEAEL